MNPKAISDDECQRRFDIIMAKIGPRHGLKTLDLFAELLCGGDDYDLAIPPMQASVLIGYSANYGNALFQRIRKGLGDWAV